MDDETALPDAWAEIGETTERLGETVDAYLSAVDAHELGGVWFDGMSRIAVSFTSRVAEHREALEDLVGRENVTVLAATFSGAELQALADRIADAMEMEPGRLINYVAVDEEEGRVKVGVRTLDDDARAEIHRRWPHSAVIVIEGPRFRFL